MIGHPLTEEQLQRAEMERRLQVVGQALERLQKRRFEEFPSFLVGERLLQIDFGAVAQAVECVICDMALEVVMQLVPEQREPAALMMLKHISDHMQLALQGGAPVQTTEAPDA